ncbi:MAG: class I SAM-dependent methyltransferase [Phycisphaerae bacterium]
MSIWSETGQGGATAVCQLCDFAGPMPALYAAKGIVRCPRCGLAFYPDQVDTSGLYTEGYFSGQEYRDYLADEGAIRKNFRCRLADLGRLTAGKPGGRLLEIGCAYGLFLDEARRSYDVSGIDIAASAIAHARDKLHLNVRVADFLDVHDEPAAYDIICLWDTIEHLRFPIRYIEKAARWLRPGGLLALSTGDIGSFVARRRKARWRLIHPPTHLFYFSVRTLEMAVRRAGLSPAMTRHVGFHRSYKSIAYGLFVANGKGHRVLYNLATLWGSLDFTISLNFRDIVMYVARKGTY